MICLVRGMEYQEKDGRFFHFGGGGGYDEVSETDGEASRRMQQMATVERELFSRVISKTHGNQAKAARWLGITRYTLREKLARYGLKRLPTDKE